MSSSKDDTTGERRPHTGEPLSAYVRRALDGYFAQLGDQEPSDLHRLVMNEVERPLFEYVMNHCSGNQTRAARVLGVNRGTLRKKLREHGIE